jgi:hypothetical protein
MGIRLVESIKLSCSGADPRWDLCRRTATAVLFDGEAFAVSCAPADHQPDGPYADLDWSAIASGPFLPAAVAGWYGPCELEQLESLSDLACDGYIAEPAA